MVLRCLPKGGELMAKGRSPNYPSITLAESVERLKPLYDSIHTRRATRELIAQNLGYKGLNGRSLTLIATLRRYGLLEQEKKGELHVGERAVSIMELSKGNSERAKAFKDAAFEPLLFSHLRDDFGETLPKDETLKHYLIKKEFLPNAAEEIIRVYRANLELVKEEEAAYDALMSTQRTGPQHSIARSEIERAVMNRASVQETLLSEGADASKQLRFNISRDSEAQVIFRGPVTQEAIEKLAALLELQKDTFPKQVELDAKELDAIADSN
jgi:hypothetical protein